MNVGIIGYRIGIVETKWNQIVTDIFNKKV